MRKPAHLWCFIRWVYCQIRLRLKNWQIYSVFRDVIKSTTWQNAYDFEFSNEVT